MRNVKQEIEEDYDTGEYSIKRDVKEDIYTKFINNRNNILSYAWGVWVTSYAFRNLHLLGAAVADDGIWLYSDTDSCYATKWDYERLNHVNDIFRSKLKANGYNPITFKGKEYCLGVAETSPEDHFTEFITQGAKRYCKRTADGLHITVAGVPKKGVECLENNILNFAPGLIFPGKVTGKLTHTYFYVDEIYIDQDGNETGDSIDLSPCDYLLGHDGVVEYTDIEELFDKVDGIQIYEEE